MILGVFLLKANEDDVSSGEIAGVHGPPSLVVQIWLIISKEEGHKLMFSLRNDQNKHQRTPRSTPISLADSKSFTDFELPFWARAVYRFFFQKKGPALRTAVQRFYLS